MIDRFKARLQRKFKDESFADIVKGSSATFAVRIFGLLAGYLFVFLISRIYGSGVLGAHTLSTTVLMMFTVPGRLGMDLAIVKHFAQHHAEGRWDKILEVYYKTLRVVIPLGILLSVILFFTSGLFSHHLFKKPHLEPYFKIISFAVLPMILRFINSECYRGFRMHREYAYSQNVGYLLYASVILGILSVILKHEWLPNIALASSLVILAISSSFLIIRKIKKHTSHPSEEITGKELVSVAMPMMLVNSMLLISGWINTIMLGIFSTQSDVGIYAVIIKVATFSSFVLIAINSIAAPRFAQLHASGKPEELKHYISQTATVIFYTSLPIFAGIVFFREWILGLFGEEFKVGATALLITMAGQLFNVLAGSVGQFLNMTGKQKIFRNIVLISTFINIIACVVFIPKYGVIGSALAGMIFMASWNLMAMIYIRNKLGLRTYYWPFGKYI